MNTILLDCCSNVAQPMTQVLKWLHESDVTNECDVAIAFIICVAVVLVALIAKCAILSWKEKENKAIKDERQDKEKKEDKEYGRKMAADKRDREWRLADEDRKRANAIADEERKRKYDLLDKKLQLLDELCHEIKEINKSEECKENKDGKEAKTENKSEIVIKQFGSEEVKAYLSAINEAIGTTQKEGEAAPETTNEKVVSETTNGEA